jgi:hypothetical protein
MASTGGLHSLATIIKRCVQMFVFPSDLTRCCRLEAATSRLEDLAALGQNAATQGSNTTIISPQSNEPTPVPPPPPPPPSAASAASAELPQSVIAFDELVLEGKLKPFLELTKSFASQSVIDQVSELRDLSWLNYNSIISRLDWSRRNSRVYASFSGPLRHAKSLRKRSWRKSCCHFPKTSRLLHVRRRRIEKIEIGIITIRHLLRVPLQWAGSLS